MRLLGPLLGLSLLQSGAAQRLKVSEAQLPRGAVALATHVGGRVQGQVDSGEPSVDRKGVLYQWPGTYFSARFRGRGVYFKTGAGRQDLRVAVDGQQSLPLVTAAAGVYRVAGLKAGDHMIRLEVISENQAGPDGFLGFFVRRGMQTEAPTKQARQMEFIGDSYTVGYGNTSEQRICKGDEVWSTTDNSLAFGPLTATHYGADYQVNAISGRGVSTLR